MSEWINVKDALPERHDEVFVQHIDGKIFAAYINAYGRWTRLSDGKNLGCSFYIKRWYKPEPPKPEGPFYACQSGRSIRIVFNLYLNRPGIEALAKSCGHPINDDIPALVQWLNDIWAKHKP